jgi:hypothetical protein
MRADFSAFAETPACNRVCPGLRRQVFEKLKHLVTPACPFVNLPETRRTRFGEELNAEKMKKAVW